MPRVAERRGRSPPHSVPRDTMRASIVPRTPCLRFVRHVHKSMCVACMCLHRMDVAGHDSHNTNRLVITHARPGFVDTEFAIARENCTCAMPH